VLYLDHLSNLYYIMSDVKHHVNAKTSILGRQYTMAVTFEWVVFVLECVILSKKCTRHVIKWQATNTDNKNDKTV